MFKVAQGLQKQILIGMVNTWCKKETTANDFSLQVEWDELWMLITFKDSTAQNDSASWEHWKRKCSSIWCTFCRSPQFHLHKAWGKTRWALNNAWLGTIIHQCYQLLLCRMRHGRESKQESCFLILIVLFFILCFWRKHAIRVF
jgi:hypothetical protein